MVMESSGFRLDTKSDEGNQTRVCPDFDWIKTKSREYNPDFDWIRNKKRENIEENIIRISTG